jgi:CBS domain-containing protein
LDFTQCTQIQQRKSVMKVKDVMHKGVDWVSPDTPVTELAKLMREHDIGAIPIGENDRLIGMVTDRDIVCKGLAQDSFDAGRATAADVMAPGIHCCREDDDLAKAIRHMETLKVRRLPVINKSKRMVGILSLGDLSHSAAICCPNGPRAFRRTTEPSDASRPAEDLFFDGRRWRCRNTRLKSLPSASRPRAFEHSVWRKKLKVTNARRGRPKT